MIPISISLRIDKRNIIGYLKQIDNLTRLDEKTMLTFMDQNIQYIREAIAQEYWKKKVKLVPTKNYIRLKNFMHGRYKKVSDDIGNAIVQFGPRDRGLLTGALFSHINSRTGEKAAIIYDVENFNKGAKVMIKLNAKLFSKSGEVKSYAERINDRIHFMQIHHVRFEYIIYKFNKFLGNLLKKARIKEATVKLLKRTKG